VRFGTSYRIINLIAALQIVTIVLSRGDVFLLGEAYAFGVVWSFTMEALAVLVLRYRYPRRREYSVPLNIDWGRIHIPIGLGLITLSLLAIAIVNLLTKSIATVVGLTFTVVLFSLFTLSERVMRRQAASQEQVDQFHLAGAEELTNETVGVRPGNVLVMIHNYRRLDHLESVLERVRPEHYDIVALQIRVLEAGASGDRGIVPEQLFTANEQVLFTRALMFAEKHGKSIHLALMAANQLWDGMVHAAQSLQSAIIVVGPSATMSPREEARLAGLAWERLPTPKRRAVFEVFIPPAQRAVFYLGPHTPHLTPKEIDVLHRLGFDSARRLAQRSCIITMLFILPLQKSSANWLRERGQRSWKDSSSTYKRSRIDVRGPSAERQHRIITACTRAAFGTPKRCVSSRKASSLRSCKRPTEIKLGPPENCTSTVIRYIVSSATCG
jgi:hypothetical protein